MQKKLRNTFQRLWPDEFSSGDFGLRSFRRPEPLPKYFHFHYYHINKPEQFTVTAQTALFEGEGEGDGRAKNLKKTFQRLRPEEFSSEDFGLRSFRQPKISACITIPACIGCERLSSYAKVINQ